MINSGEWTGMESAVLKKEAPAEIEEKGFGKKTVNYKLRDWVFSRQRYWGEPIPIIHCPNCGNVPVPEEELPLELPAVEKYEPTGTGESPLAAIDSWVNCTCPVCGAPAKRETNTMPQWAGSSWYFLRYVDNKNDEALVSKEKADKYLPVDMYIGGVEHAVLHLLYSRFYTKFLYDIGVVDFDEPFTKLFNQGMITGKNGIKMSKSKGNVVSPDDLVEDYGCDSLRMYEMFVGPPELDAEWDDRGIDGVNRFLRRFWTLAMDRRDKGGSNERDDPCAEPARLRCHEPSGKLQPEYGCVRLYGIQQQTDRNQPEERRYRCRDHLHLRAAAGTVCTAYRRGNLGAYGHTDSIFHSTWPVFDEEAMKEEDTIELPVSVNGKTRGVISVPEISAKRMRSPRQKEAVADRLTGEIVKEIYVPGKMVNIVVKRAERACDFRQTENQKRSQFKAKTVKKRTDHYRRTNMERILTGEI